MSKAPRQVISDARAIRALAHPLRVQLMELIGREGEITASRAAEALGESPGNMSWHLQTLAKYGLVEEGPGKGRSRPWHAVSRSRSFDTGMTDPEQAAAGEALERTLLARTAEQLREWWALRLTYPEKWRRAAFVSDTVAYLTPEELREVMEEIISIYQRFEERRTLERRPKDAAPVRLYAHGHPLPPTPSGN